MSLCIGTSPATRTTVAAFDYLPGVLDVLTGILHGIAGVQTMAGLSLGVDPLTFCRSVLVSRTALA